MPPIEHLRAAQAAWERFQALLPGRCSIQVYELKAFDSSGLTMVELARACRALGLKIFKDPVRPCATHRCYIRQPGCTE